MPVTPNLFPAPAVTIKTSPDTANVPGGGGAKFITEGATGPDRPGFHNSASNYQKGESARPSLG